MEQEKNLSKKETSENRRKNLAKCADVLAKFFQKWNLTFPNQKAGKALVAVYIECLQDLTPEQLEIGCAEASKDMEQFPKPGHIRHAWEQYTALNHWERLGPPRPDYLDEPANCEKPEWKALMADVAKMPEMLSPLDITMKQAGIPKKEKRTIVERTPDKDAELERAKQILKARGWLH